MQREDHRHRAVAGIEFLPLARGQHLARDRVEPGRADAVGMRVVGQLEANAHGPVGLAGHRHVADRLARVNLLRARHDLVQRQARALGRALGDRRRLDRLLPHGGGNEIAQWPPGHVGAGGDRHRDQQAEHRAARAMQVEQPAQQATVEHDAQRRRPARRPPQHQARHQQHQVGQRDEGEDALAGAVEQQAVVDLVDQVVGTFLCAAPALFGAGEGIEVDRAVPAAAHQHPVAVAGLARRAQGQVGVGAELGQQALAQRLQRQPRRGGVAGRARDEEFRVGLAVERLAHDQCRAEQGGDGEDRAEREADPAVDLEPETSQGGAQHGRRGRRGVPHGSVAGWRTAGMRRALARKLEGNRNGRSKRITRPLIGLRRPQRANQPLGKSGWCIDAQGVRFYRRVRPPCPRSWPASWPAGGLFPLRESRASGSGHAAPRPSRSGRASLP